MMTREMTMKKLLVAGTIGVFVLASGACADPSNDEQQTDERFADMERPESMSREERIAMRQKMQAPRDIEMLPEEELTDEAPAVTGEVPDDLLDKIYADLEQNVGADRSAFKLVRAEAVQWPDGSLGCPEPGMNYTQMLVNGYWVVISHGDQEHDYRASERGYFVLCRNPLKRMIQEKEKGPRSGAPVQ